MMSLATDRATWTIALIGNPNTGKSTLFGALSGDPAAGRQLPGRHRREEARRGVPRRPTVGPRRPARHVQPRPGSPDEMVAVDVLLGRRPALPAPDVVLCIVDADNLERNLYLVSQVLELGLPTVIAALRWSTWPRLRGCRSTQTSSAIGSAFPWFPVQAHRRIGMDRSRRPWRKRPERPGRPGEPVPAGLPRGGRPCSSRSDGRWQRGQRRRETMLRRVIWSSGCCSTREVTSRSDCRADGDVVGLARRA